MELTTASAGDKAYAMSEELTQSTNGYEVALSSAYIETHEDHTPRELQLFLTRDKIQSALLKAVDISPEVLQRIEDLDRDLKSRLLIWKPLVDPKSLRRFHDYLHPPEESWWWYLRPPAGSLVTLSLSVMTLILVAVVFSLVADISRRFVSTGTDAYSIVALAAQAVVALFAASTFTQAGNAWLEGTFARLGILRPHFAISKIITVLLLLLVASSFRAALPYLARRDNESGVVL